MVIAVFLGAWCVHKGVAWQYLGGLAIILAGAWIVSRPQLFVRPAVNQDTAMKLYLKLLFDSYLILKVSLILSFLLYYLSVIVVCCLNIIFIFVHANNSV
jgi:hypothetical protein